MSDNLELELRKFRNTIANGNIHQALREVLALRPPPKELAKLLRDSLPQADREGRSALDIIHMVTSSACHVAEVGIAIRQALPEFQDWRFDVDAAATRFFAGQGDRELPPGFSEGRPGAFLRATRGIVKLKSDGAVNSLYEHIQNSPNEQSLSAEADQIRISEVLDLTWMAAGQLELRSVQERIEALCATVLPGQAIRFSPYDEPRYRAALQAHFLGFPARAAIGGVLVDWPGRLANVDAAHIRLFLEPWAAVQSGEAVEYRSSPQSRP